MSAPQFEKFSAHRGDPQDQIVRLSPRASLAAKQEFTDNFMFWNGEYRSARIDTLNTFDKYQKIKLISGLALSFNNTTSCAVLVRDTLALNETWVHEDNLEVKKSTNPPPTASP